MSHKKLAWLMEIHLHQCNNMPKKDSKCKSPEFDIAIKLDTKSRPRPGEATKRNKSLSDYPILSEDAAKTLLSQYVPRILPSDKR